MTVESTLRKNTYTGTGATATYNYGFEVFDALHLLVKKTDLSAVVTTLTPTVDYTVTGVGNAAGGTITLTAGNLPAGFGLSIERVVPFTQLADLRNAGGFYPETIEEALDKLCMMIQQFGESDVTALTIQVTNLDSDLTALTVRVTNLENDDAYKDVPISTTVTGTVPITDRGKCIPATGGITIPANVFPAGGTFNIINNSASPITITQGAGLTLRNSGTTDTGNRTMAPRAICNVLFLSTTECYIAGPGVT